MMLYKLLSGTVFRNQCHPRHVRGGTMSKANGGVERSETVWKTVPGAKESNNI